MTTSDWCRASGVDQPRLETVANHREANTFALLLVTLLERGEPMTLAEVAVRFEQAGIAERSNALLSLKRCKPGRPPVYRDGDRYHLDPHDDELDLWLFRLGLKPPNVAPPAPQARQDATLPSPDVALTSEELDEAWNGSSLSSWSAQRLVLAVLDANNGPLAPAEIVAAIAKRTRWYRLDEQPAKFKRAGSAVRVLDDGRWGMASEATETLKQVRVTLRERIALVRRNAPNRLDPATFAATRADLERRRAAHAAELARMSRALLVAFPPLSPRAVVLLDVGEHTLSTFVDEQLDALPARLSAYDVLGGVDIRRLLRALAFDPGERRLAELGPPQKTKQISKRGRTLKITTALLVQGSCGISKPFGEEEKLAHYLATGESMKLLRRLEADAKSLYALYQYGRLHGAVRLRWGFVDELIPAPWVQRDESTLYNLKKSALAMGVPLEVIVGSAPSWSEPWSRARTAYVEEEVDGWRTWLVDEDGGVIADDDVQCARLSAALH
jgi:hypothetical protein